MTHTRGNTLSQSYDGDDCGSRSFVMNRRRRHGKDGAHSCTCTYTYTRARASRLTASFVSFVTYVTAFTRRLSARRGEKPVLEVRKRTTTTHHRLATALLPLSAFPYKLRATAVSLLLDLPLSLRRSPTRGSTENTTVRSSRHVARRSCDSVDSDY